MRSKKKVMEKIEFQYRRSSHKYDLGTSSNVVINCTTRLRNHNLGAECNGDLPLFLNVG